MRGLAGAHIPGHTIAHFLIACSNNSFYLLFLLYYFVLSTTLYDCRKNTVPTGDVV